MRTFFLLFFVGGLLSSNVLCAAIPKTFLGLQGSQIRIPTRLLTWCKEQGDIELNRCGSVFDLHTFYSKTFDTQSMREYFGQSTIGVGPDEVLKPEDILHDGFAGATVGRTLRDAYELHPSQSITGLYFSYFQQLCDISPHLGISCELSFVSVINRLGLCRTAGAHGQNMREVTDVDPNRSGTGKQFFLRDYLEGRVDYEGLQNQKPLQKMKISFDSLQSIGPADLLMRLHGLLFYRAEKLLDVSLHLRVPCDASEYGNYLFEPIRGTGGRWGLGIKFEGATRFFWNNNTTSLHLLGSVQYDYILKARASRALGFKRQDESYSPWQMYRLAGTFGENRVEPLANILTQRVKLNPNNRLQVHVQGGIEHSGMAWCWGTDFYFQEKETIALCRWKENTYNVVAKNYDTTISFDPSTHKDPTEGIGSGIKKNDLMLDLATTEAFCLQSMYAYVSKMFVSTEQSKIVFALGAGCSVAYGENQKSRIGEKWFVWTRFGILV